MPAPTNAMSAMQPRSRAPSPHFASGKATSTCSSTTPARVSGGSAEEITADGFELAWRVNALGALLVSKEVIPAMKNAGHGNIVFIGATASRRGNVKTAAFAPAKAAQRILAESMARTLWPAGVHVSLIIVDGVVDIASTRKMMADKPDTFFVAPADLADVVYAVTKQKPSAWSFEVEARPFAEKW